MLQPRVALLAAVLCLGCTPRPQGPPNTLTFSPTIYVDDPSPPAPVPCDDGTDVFTPIGSSFTLPNDLGHILACNHMASVSSSELSATAQYTSHGWTAENGYEEYAIQFVSQGPVGTARHATALLYLPTGGTAPYPIVAVNHGTNGVGANCGPTKMAIASDYMALPLVGHGYAVVAVDYLGMGIDEGVYSYGVGEAEGRTILDGVRALKYFDDGTRFPNTSFGNELFVLGHSQGGQATLFAHQLYHPSVGRTLLGSVTLAPGLGDIRNMNNILGQGLRPMDATMVFVTMILYSSASYYGSPDHGAWLSSSGQDRLPNMLRDDCYAQLIVDLPTAFPLETNLFGNDFLNNARGCPFDDRGCPTFAPWESYLRANVPGNFSSDVPAMVLQGETDTVVPPYTTACVAKRLADHGVNVTACGYSGTDHYTLVDNSANDFLAWMSARRSGQTTGCPAAISASCP